MGFWSSVGSLISTLSELAEEINSKGEWASKQSNASLKRNYDDKENSFAKRAAVYKEAEKRSNKKK